MIYTRRNHLQLLCGALASGIANALADTPDFTAYSDSEKEKFLSVARIVSSELIGHGVTKPIKLQMELNGVQHLGQIQTVDKELPDFYPEGGGPPVPMRDSWKFNVAAYKIDRLLDLKMVPVTIARPFKNKPAALTWWVDDVMFEETDRVKKDLTAPDPENWERQRALGRVFDELIINIDRNLSNLLITNSWNLVLIDHSRSFTAYDGIRNQANLTRCSRGLIMKLKTLAAADVKTAVGPLLTDAQIRAMMMRRDRIVDFFEQAAKTKGAENVLFS